MRVQKGEARVMIGVVIHKFSSGMASMNSGDNEFSNNMLSNTADNLPIDESSHCCSHDTEIAQ
jgi:hypothetical protein